MPGLAAVTGGTGFVGQHVVRALAAEGWRLRLLVRGQPAGDMGEEPVELVPGSLEDEGSLGALTEGADAVVHIAGKIKAISRESFMAANADGTARLLRARSERAPDAPFVLMSSLAAREPGLSHYAASKAAAEDHVRASDGPWSILRPSAIYGPGDRETLAVFKMARLLVHPLLNSSEARVCLIHIDDVVSATTAATRGALPNATYELSDEHVDGYTWREIVGAACQTMETRPRPVRIPAAVVKTLGWAGDILSGMTGSAEMLTSQKVREVLHPDWSSSRSAQPPCDTWSPQVDLAQGFGRTVASHRERGWL
ncbi:MAG: NAD-dependent epimerase/dehydratase family protein [Pseudomonadota bacterium]